YERIRMNLREEAFRWDMLGSPVHVGKLAERLPALPINSLTPNFKNTFAKDIIVENAKAFVRIEGIPESPMENFVIENATVNSKKLFNAHDAKLITVKNSTINTEDHTISLIDVKDLTFKNVYFKTSKGEVVTTVSGEHSDNIHF